MGSKPSKGSSAVDTKSTGTVNGVPATSHAFASQRHDASPAVPQADQQQRFAVERDILQGHGAAGKRGLEQDLFAAGDGRGEAALAGGALQGLQVCQVGRDLALVELARVEHRDDQAVTLLVRFETGAGLLQRFAAEAVERQVRPVRISGLDALRPGVDLDLVPGETGIAFRIVARRAVERPNPFVGVRRGTLQTVDDDPQSLPRAKRIWRWCDTSAMKTLGTVRAKGPV